MLSDEIRLTHSRSPSSRGTEYGCSSDSTNETQSYSLHAILSFGSSFTGFPHLVEYHMNRAVLSSQGPFPPFTHPVGHSISTLNAIRRCYYAEIALNNLFSFHTPDWIFRAFIFLFMILPLISAMGS